MQIFLLIFLSVSLFSSCAKDEDDNPPVNTSKGVLIANEGLFQSGNAKVSYYNIEEDALTEDLFQPANNRPLGDVLQSIFIHGSKTYLVVNNSQKIEVVNKETFVSEAMIGGFTSPRYFLPVSESKAYVTDLFGNAISVVNLNSNSIIGAIPCAGWTEELILSNGKAFITNLSNDKIYVVNVATDQMEDSIIVSYAPGSIVKDKNGKLWTLCGGDAQNNLYAGLHRINPLTLNVELSLQFSSLSESPWKLRINGSGDTLYFINNGVFRMTVSDIALPSSAFIAKDNRNFNGLGIDPLSEIIYVSDAIDYVQRGMVYRYNADGTLRDSFLAGIVPGEFWFD